MKLSKKEYDKLYYIKNKERLLAKEKRNKLRSRYGLTLDQWQALIDSQDRKCPCCDQSLDLLTPKNVHVDHCHTTGKVRGVLCINCNSGLGIFKDDPKALRKAAAYLEASS